MNTSVWSRDRICARTKSPRDMTIYDFRSDTVTLPSPEMMAAIANARLGDSARGDDPTVNELEHLARELTGKDDALLVPSGTMANLSAVIGHECCGGEAIVEAASHIYRSEGGGLSVLAGAIPRAVEGRYGIIDPDDLKAAIRVAPSRAAARTKVICLENTHSAAGGVVVPMETMAATYDVARNAGIPVHLDGARLFNAGAYLDVPILEICKHVDSVCFALCKGLGGPVGSILAGTKDFMAKARRAAKMLGGGMRQAGLIAAPAIVALQDPYPVHRRDHQLARRLARGLATIDGSLVDVDRVQTNIVNCFVDRFSSDAVAINLALRKRGILANNKLTKIRFVTHCQIDDVAVEVAINQFSQVIDEIQRAA
jgi:threonine aldolase